MNASTRSHIAIALLACLPLAACNNSDAPTATSTPSSTSATAGQPTSALGRVVEKELRQARVKLATENITIGSFKVRSGNHGSVRIFDEETHKADRPKAEISPAGDLLIAGKTVAITPEQRALLLGYRADVIGIAEGGMDIGMQGADLATHAMGEAFKGIFNGKSEQDITHSVEAEAAKIKQSAAKLCSHLPSMLTTQQQLAASLPAFVPYATMTQADIDDCAKDIDTQQGGSATSH